MSTINSLGYTQAGVNPYEQNPFADKQTSQTTSEGLLSQTDLADAAQKQLELRAKRLGAKNSYASGGISSDIGKAALNRALSEMQGKVDGAVTFDKIYEYQNYLELKFTVDVKMEMSKRGVDEDQEFTIAMNAQGEVSVACDDPRTKELVLEYLKENPSRCDEFGYIQALGNLKRAQQTAVWPGTQMSKAEIVTSAIEAMFDETLNSGAMDFSSLTAKFNGLAQSHDVKFYTGLSYSV